MGVSRLWDLIAPCGRRISLDVLSRKRLAVDASIWLIQFNPSGWGIHNVDAPLSGACHVLWGATGAPWGRAEGCTM